MRIQWITNSRSEGGDTVAGTCLRLVNSVSIMSWFRKSELSFLQRFVGRILKAGPIPKHLAFIMDGNRRFANKKKLANVVTGHEQGFEKLTEVCDETSDCNDNTHHLRYVIDSKLVP